MQLTNNIYTRSEKIFCKLINHTVEILFNILKSEYPADSIIDKYFRANRYLGSHDRRFIVETVYGTLRQLRKCQYIFESVNNNLKIEANEKEVLLYIVAIYLFLYGELSDAHFNELNKIFKDRESPFNKIKKFISERSFTKGISNFLPLSINYSFPDWLIEYLTNDYGEEEVKNICESLNQPAPLNLRVNTLKTDVEGCIKALEEEGIKAYPTKYSPVGLVVPKRINVFSLKSFKNGWFEVQDEGSQLIPIIIDPKPTIKLLDLCAGAGGKTLEFAAIMKNRGEIFATDINNYKLLELRKRARRAGANNIRIVEIKKVSDLLEKYKEFFDIVFVDAPCSGTGTIRRNPDIKWRITEKTVTEVVKKQKTILQESISLVKKGGLLIYVTCSILREENEKQAENFLNLNKEFNLVSLKEKAFKFFNISSRNDYFQVKPSSEKTDGFFCAVMKKN